MSSQQAHHKLFKIYLTLFDLSTMLLLKHCRLCLQRTYHSCTNN